MNQEGSEGPAPGGGAGGSERVGVIGAGYVGLVTGVCLASLGFQVTIRDIDEDKVATLERGEVPIYEPGLAELLAEHAERIDFTLSLELLLERVDVVVVAVNTPDLLRRRRPLAGQSVVDELERVGAGGEHVLVMKSTVPVGTGERVRAELDARGLSHVGYCSNPEFVKEGAAIHDFLHPDRIVIGAFDPAHGDRVESLYRALDAPVVRTRRPRFDDRRGDAGLGAHGWERLPRGPTGAVHGFPPLSGRRGAARDSRGARRRRRRAPGGLHGAHRAFGAAERGSHREPRPRLTIILGKPIGWRRAGRESRHPRPGAGTALRGPCAQAVSTAQNAFQFRLWGGRRTPLPRRSRAPPSPSLGNRRASPRVRASGSLRSGAPGARVSDLRQLAGSWRPRFAPGPDRGADLVAGAGQPVQRHLAPIV